MTLFDAVPVVGQGTWEIERDRRSAVRALMRGFELGMTHVDTAEMYGDGWAEEIVGEALEGRRDEVCVVSKVLPHNASYERTIRACEKSLARLRIERLDCYLLHWRGGVPLEETFRAFDDLVAAGKIAVWGVSNFDVGDLEEAETIAGRGKIACNQVLYNLWKRTIEHRVLPWCKNHDIAVVAYSPFDQGGRLQQTKQQKAVMAAIAEAHRVGEHSVALRFLIDQGTWVIPKASKMSHVEENAEALTFQLTDTELSELDRAFPRGKDGPLPML